jgi:hypothetical protein
MKKHLAACGAQDYIDLASQEATTDGAVSARQEPRTSFLWSSTGSPGCPPPPAGDGSEGFRFLGTWAASAGAGQAINAGRRTPGPRARVQRSAALGATLRPGSAWSRPGAAGPDRKA